MDIKLARNWFDPSATLREVRLNPHIDLPDDWEKFLPTGAEILDGKGNTVRKVGDKPDPQQKPNANPSTSAGELEVKTPAVKK